MKRRFLFCLVLLLSVFSATALADTLEIYAGSGSLNPAVDEVATAVALDTYAAKIDRYGNLYVVEEEYGGNTLNRGMVRINPWGKVDKVYNSGLLNDYADDIAVDGDGNAYLPVYDGGCIYRMDLNGNLSVFAGICGSPGYSGDGGLATGAQLTRPESLAFDNDGNLYIGDGSWGNPILRKVDVNGIITTIYSGTDFGFFSAIYADALGNVYVPDANKVFKISPAGTISVIAGTGINGHSGDGGPATAAEMGWSLGITGDIWGNLYISESYGGVDYIRKIDAQGTISSVSVTEPPGNGYFSRLSTDIDGHVFVTRHSGSYADVLKLAFAPQIQTFTPEEGVVGDRVVISGRYFTSHGVNGQVTFDGTPANILSWSNETIVCEVPAGASKTVPVVVTTPDQQVSNGVDFRVR